MKTPRCNARKRAGRYAFHVCMLDRGHKGPHICGTLLGARGSHPCLCEWRDRLPDSSCPASLKEARSLEKSETITSATCLGQPINLLIKP